MSQRDGLLWTGIDESNEPASLKFCMRCSLPGLISSSHNFGTVMLQGSVTWTRS